MSTRTMQARKLAGHLSQMFGCEVTLEWESGDRWNLQWSDGPTRELMRGALGELAAAYPLMADRSIRTLRIVTARAWAVRAAAALRDGSLRSALGQFYQPGEANVRTAQERDARLFLDDVLDKTSDPDRLSDPADEPVVARLLDAGKAIARLHTSNPQYAYASDHTMADPLIALLNGETVNLPGTSPADLPANVTPLFRKDRP